MSTETESAEERPRRIIKRYSNRKLYDTQESKYVTLSQIADLVRLGFEVQVVDNATKEDKTEQTLALIISEEVKTRPKSVPLGTLRDIVHTRSEKFLSQLREGPIGRLMGQTPDAEGGTPEEAAAEPAKTEPAKPSEAPKGRLQDLVDSSKQTIDQWQAAIDERVRALLPNVFREMQADIKKLTHRVEELESRLKVARAKASEKE